MCYFSSDELHPVFRFVAPGACVGRPWSRDSALIAVLIAFTLTRLAEPSEAVGRKASLLAHASHRREHHAILIGTHLLAQRTFAAAQRELQRITESIRPAHETQTARF